MSRLCRFALACWLLCCLAFAGVAARANDFVDFAKVGSYLDLTFRLEILEDSAAALTSEQVLLQPSWQPARPQNLNRGVTNAAVWLKFQVENRSGKSLERWLTLGSPRLEQVDYYRLRSGNAQPVETAVSGLAHPLALRPEAGLVSIFPVKLDPGESATLLLRVAGRTRMLLEPGLWEPLAYRAQESDLTVRQLVPLCALLGVALCMLLHSLVRRDRSLLLLATWLSVLALFEFSFRGHLYRAVFYEGGEPAVRATVVLTNLVMLLCASFTLLFLRLYQQRGWRLAYLLFVLANLLLILQAAFADLRAANVLTVPLLVLFFVIWPISILAAWHRGVANAGLFSLASFGLCLAIVLRLVEQMGWLKNDVISGDNVTTQPSLVLALVMGYGLVRSSFVEQKAYRAAQAALLKSRQDEHVRLEALVRERTQTLQNAVIVADEAHRARAELLARVNHDLRRPAAEIVDLVAPFLQATGEQQEYGTVIRRSATHLQGLIDDLIVEAGAGSPLGGIKPEPVEILGLLEGLAAEAEGLARAGGNEFDFSPGPGLPPQLLVDAKRLRQVLINLLDNAAKFTQGGRVEFKVDVNQGPVPVTLIFSVRDTGPGMSASQLAMVFEPYRRANESAGFPGLGLGLAIARHWAERMGGEIVADSVPGQGTTMRVLLPVDLPELAMAPQSKAPDEPMPTEGSAGLAVPAPERLVEAVALLRLGAVSDLLDWAADLQDSQPQHAAFARSVAELAERGDLRALALLLGPATPAGPAGAAGANRTAGPVAAP